MSISTSITKNFDVRTQQRARRIISNAEDPLREQPIAVFLPRLSSPPQHIALITSANVDSSATNINYSHVKEMKAELSVLNAHKVEACLQKAAEPPKQQSGNVMAGWCKGQAVEGANALAKTLSAQLKLSKERVLQHQFAVKPRQPIDGTKALVTPLTQDPNFNVDNLDATTTQPLPNFFVTGEAVGSTAAQQRLSSRSGRSHMTVSFSKQTAATSAEDDGDARCTTTAGSQRDPALTYSTLKYEIDRVEQRFPKLRWEPCGINTVLDVAKHPTSVVVPPGLDGAIVRYSIWPKLDEDIASMLDPNVNWEYLSSTYRKTHTYTIEKDRELGNASTALQPSPPHVPLTSTSKQITSAGKGHAQQVTSNTENSVTLPALTPNPPPSTSSRNAAVAAQYRGDFRRFMSDATSQRVQFHQRCSDEIRRVLDDREKFRVLKRRAMKGVMSAEEPAPWHSAQKQMHKDTATTLQTTFRRQRRRFLALWLKQFRDVLPQQRSSGVDKIVEYVEKIVEQPDVESIITPAQLHHLVHSVLSPFQLLMDDVVTTLVLLLDVSREEEVVFAEWVRSRVHSLTTDYCGTIEHDLRRVDQDMKGVKAPPRVTLGRRR